MIKSFVLILILIFSVVTSGSDSDELRCCCQKHFDTGGISTACGTTPHPITGDCEYKDGVTFIERGVDPFTGETVIIGQGMYWACEEDPGDTPWDTPL